jgi:hypothetical protein
MRRRSSSFLPRPPPLKYDITLKTLLMDGAPALLTQLAGTSAITLTPAEYPVTVSRRVDLVGRIESKQILHVEAQSTNDQRIPVRMLGYYWVFVEDDPSVEVIQVVLYVGSEPLRMPDGLSRAGLTLKYTVIDARTLDPAPLLASNSVADVVASFLCRADNMEERIREILERLRVLCAGDDTALGDALSRLVVLGDLRRAEPIIEKEIRDMPITINIENNPILMRLYTRGLTEGKAEGKEEGKAEGKAEILMRQMRHRYGALPETAVATVLAARPAELDLWADAIFETDSLADLLARRAEA